MTVESASPLRGLSLVSKRGEATPRKKTDDSFESDCDNDYDRYSTSVDASSSHAKRQHPQHNAETIEEWTGGQNARAALLASAAYLARPLSPKTTAAAADKYAETRSTLSSPGKTSLRERLLQKLMQEQNHRQQAAVEIQQAISNPPPPPPTPPPPNSPRLPTSKDILVSYNRVNSDDSDIALRERDMPGSGENDNQVPSTSPKAVGIYSDDKENDVHQGSSLIRLSRHALYNRRVEALAAVRANRVLLHVYDLIHDETVVALPFGCTFPIGQCFSAVNNGLHALGTGAYHCGIEVNGIEYAYGACTVEGATGVFTCIPKHSPGYQYRTTLDFGIRKVIRKSWVESKSSSSGYKQAEVYVDGRDIMKEMAFEYKGIDYDLLRRNCCTFARDACLRLGITEKEIPTWFMNLAEAGVATQDAATSPLYSITSMLSMHDDDECAEEEIEERETGFEVIAGQSATGDFAEGKTLEIVRIVDALELERHGVHDDAEQAGGPIVMRRTWSWTY